MERHQPCPCRRLRSRSCWLQLLKLKPGVSLQSQRGAGEVGRGLGPGPLRPCLQPSPRGRCHDAAAVLPEVAAVAETPSAIMAHAQVVPQLMGHRGGNDEDADRVILPDRAGQGGPVAGDGEGRGILTMLTPPERAGEHMEA